MSDEIFAYLLPELSLIFKFCHPMRLSTCPELRFFSSMFSYVRHCQFYILFYLQMI